MKPAPFELVRPDTLAAAHAALDTGGLTVLLAGGQSLVPKLSQRLLRPALLVALDRIAELRRLYNVDGTLCLGASVTHADLEDLAADGRLGAILSAVAAGIGSRGIRNRATVAGCLANGDPLHDWQVALPALGAQIRLQSRRGERLVPAAGWLRYPFAPSLDRDEIIVSVRVPEPSPEAGWGYAKITRKMNAASLALAAVLRDPQPGRTAIAVGSAHGVSMLPELAGVLAAGRVPGPAEIEAAVPPDADLPLRAMLAGALRRAIADAA